MPRKRELGYALRVSEVERVLYAVSRLGETIAGAKAENSRLCEAYKLMCACGANKSDKLQLELFRLQNSGNWMSILLDGCSTDIEYVKSHLQCITTLIQLEAAMKADKGKEE